MRRCANFRAELVVREEVTFADETEEFRNYEMEELSFQKKAPGWTFSLANKQIGTDGLI